MAESESRRYATIADVHRKRGDGVKIILVHSSLHFFYLDSGTYHALDNRFTNLMCGRKIPTGRVAIPHRSMDSKKLCKRCIASLLTYTGDNVRFEREATV